MLNFDLGLESCIFLASPSKLNKLIVLIINNNLYISNNKCISKQRQSKFSSLPIMSGCTADVHFCSDRMLKGLDLEGPGLEG